jgi:hypothetical protein
LEPKVFSDNFERFPKSSIYPLDSKAVLVTRSGLVSHSGLLGVWLCEPPLNGAASFFRRGGFALNSRNWQEILAPPMITLLLRLACRGVFRGGLRLRRDSAARPFEPERIMPTKETAGADCAFF